MRRLLAFASVLAALPAAAQTAPPASPDENNAPAASVQAAPESIEATTEAGAPGDGRPPFRFEPLLFQAHLGAGLEVQPFNCNAAAATCRIPAFHVGGTLLWRGFLGASLGLSASAGSPLIPGDEAQAAFGDRISTSLALAVRPIAPWAWKRGDGFVTRLLAGVGLEAGPSVEYLRTSSITLPGCSLPATKVQPGGHVAASLELPLLGNLQGGWLALRVTARVIISPEAKLAPIESTPDPDTGEKCRPLVKMTTVSPQITFGLAYTF